MGHHFFEKAKKQETRVLVFEKYEKEEDEVEKLTKNKKPKKNGV